MASVLSTADRAALIDPLERAALALGQLAGRVRNSPVAAAWQARARIHGLARMLALGGVSITAAEFFRGLVGLVEPSAWPHYDWRAISIATALFSEVHPQTGLVAALQVERFGNGHLLSPTWLDELDAYRGAAAIAESAWPDVRATSLLTLGLSLHDVLRDGPEIHWASDERIDHVYRMTGWRLEAPWIGWLLAPGLSDRVVAAVGAPPLPCLVPLRRSMRYATMEPVETVRAFLAELAHQASSGLALLERQEACASAWRRRLPSTTVRSRLETALASLLIVPITTRAGLARSLGITSPGAGDLLGRLLEAGIVRREMLSPRNIFYVADEALGDFKIVPRQGRSAKPPARNDDSATLGELADAMAEVDRLLQRPQP